MRHVFKTGGWRMFAAPLLASLALFATPHPGQAQILGMQAQIPASEYDALFELYNQTGGAAWLNKSGWLNAYAASWYGVTVTGGHVTGIGMALNNLEGRLPDSLTNFYQLRNLSLNANRLSGNIPSILGNLQNLAHLDLSGNLMSGVVPDFPAFTNVLIDISGNYLTIAAGSRSLANINAMIAAGNTVVTTPQSTPPPGATLGPIVLLADGTAEVGITGTPGQAYTILVSTDLTHWTNLTSVTLVGLTGQLVDAPTTNSAARFYQAVALP